MACHPLLDGTAERGRTPRRARAATTRTASWCGAASGSSTARRSSGWRRRAGPTRTGRPGRAASTSHPRRSAPPPFAPARRDREQLLFHVAGDAAAAAALSALEASGGPEVWRPLAPALRARRRPRAGPGRARGRPRGDGGAEPSHFTMPRLMFARFGSENMAGYQPHAIAAGGGRAPGPRLGRAAQPVPQHPVRGDPSHQPREALTREQAIDRLHARLRLRGVRGERRRARWPRDARGPRAVLSRTCSRSRKRAPARDRQRAHRDRGPGGLRCGGDPYGKEPR